MARAYLGGVYTMEEIAAHYDVHYTRRPQVRDRRRECWNVRPDAILCSPNVRS